MNIYYFVGRVKEEPILTGELEKVVEKTIEEVLPQVTVQEIINETEECCAPREVYPIEKTTTPVTMPEKRFKPAIRNKGYPEKTKSIPRTQTILAKAYTKVERLEEKKAETEDRRTKVEINAKIRQIKKRPISVEEARHEKIHDLSDNLIGVFYTASYATKEDDLFLGNDEYVSRFSFRLDEKNRGGYCLRTTAYLNENGVERLRSYIRKQLKRREREEKERMEGRGKRGLNKSKIKRITRQKNTFDIKLEGIEMHLDQRGKIEIFYDYPNLQNILSNGEVLSERQNARRCYFSRFSQVKSWVYKTTNDFNQYVGQKLGELSVGVNKILAEETPCKI